MSQNNSFISQFYPCQLCPRTLALFLNFVPKLKNLFSFLFQNTGLISQFCPKTPGMIRNSVPKTEFSFLNSFSKTHGLVSQFCPKTLESFLISVPKHRPHFSLSPKTLVLFINSVPNCQLCFFKYIQ